MTKKELIDNLANYSDDSQVSFGLMNDESGNVLFLNLAYTDGKFVFDLRNKDKSTSAIITLTQLVTTIKSNARP